LKFSFRDRNFHRSIFLRTPICRTNKIQSLAKPLAHIELISGFLVDFIKSESGGSIWIWKHKLWERKMLYNCNRDEFPEAFQILIKILPRYSISKNVFLLATQEPQNLPPDLPVLKCHGHHHFFLYFWVFFKCFFSCIIF